MNNEDNQQAIEFQAQHFDNQAIPEITTKTTETKTILNLVDKNALDASAQNLPEKLTSNTSEQLHPNIQSLDIIKLLQQNQEIIKQQQLQLDEYKQLINKLSDQSKSQLEQKPAIEKKPIIEKKKEISKQASQEDADTSQMTVSQKIKFYQKKIKKTNQDKRAIIKRGQDFKNNQKNALKNFKQNEKNKGRIPCLDKDCHDTFTRKSSMKRHIINQHKDIALSRNYANFSCYICNNKMVKTPKAFQEHLEKCLQEFIQDKKDLGEISDKDLMEQDDLNSEEERQYQYGLSVCKGKQFYD